MHLPEKEIRILEDLIGRKIDGIFVPRPGVSLPVEVYILLADHKVIKIDSCSRRQNPTETFKSYPQFRIQKGQNLPGYPLENLIDPNGEIVQSIKILSEQFQSDHNFATFTSGICFHLMGREAISIMRQSVRTPALEIYGRDVMRDERYRDQRFLHFRITDL